MAPICSSYGNSREGGECFAVTYTRKIERHLSAIMGVNLLYIYTEYLPVCETHVSVSSFRYGGNLHKEDASFYHKFTLFWQHCFHLVKVDQNSPC